MNEAKMTDADMAQREKIVKSMKKNFKDFRSRYGARAKEVMYATATKMAMDEENIFTGNKKGRVGPEKPEVAARRDAMVKKKTAENDARIKELKKKGLKISRPGVDESHYPTQGSSIEYPKYKEMDMKNLVKDVIKDMPEDDGPHTSEISDKDAINFQTVADPADVVNQPNNVGNREPELMVAPRKTGKPFKSLRARRPMEYGSGVAIGESVDEADKGEYDYEGDMAKSSLKTIIRNAQMMHDMLSEDTNLPEWVQGKITLAEDYIVSASQYMQSEMNEEVELEEGEVKKVNKQLKNKYHMEKGAAVRKSFKNLRSTGKNLPHSANVRTGRLLDRDRTGTILNLKSGIDPRTGVGFNKKMKEEVSLEEGEVKKANKANKREYMRQLGTGLRYKMKSSTGPHPKYMHSDTAAGDVKTGRGVNKSKTPSDKLKQKRSIEKIAKGMHGERELRMQGGAKKENLPSSLQKIGSNFRTSDVAKAKAAGKIPLKKKTNEAVEKKVENKSKETPKKKYKKMRSQERFDARFKEVDGNYPYRSDN
jgi:hypothetical protein